MNDPEEVRQRKRRHGMLWDNTVRLVHAGLPPERLPQATLWVPTVSRFMVEEIESYLESCS